MNKSSKLSNVSRARAHVPDRRAAPSTRLAPADSDLAYTTKPVWASYLAYIDAAGADAAFMYEPGPAEPLNSGNFVALPTERMRALAAHWVALGAGLADRAGNQKGLQLLARAGAFDRCGLDAAGCADVVRRRTADEARAFLKGRRVPGKALVRTYDASFWSQRNYQCALQSPETAQVFDPCGWQAMYAHPICERFLAFFFFYFKIDLD
jgi:hypothetical protein